MNDQHDLLLFQETGSDLYEKMDDGILLCKMINLAAPDTIDERVINKGQKLSIFKVNINQYFPINQSSIPAT